MLKKAFAALVCAAAALYGAHSIQSFGFSLTIPVFIGIAGGLGCMLVVLSAAIAYRESHGGVDTFDQMRAIIWGGGAFTLACLVVPSFIIPSPTLPDWLYMISAGIFFGVLGAALSFVVRRRSRRRRRV